MLIKEDIKDSTTVKDFPNSKHIYKNKTLASAQTEIKKRKFKTY